MPEYMSEYMSEYICQSTYVRVYVSNLAGWCSPYFWGAIEHGEGSQLSQLHDLLAGQVPWLAVSNLLEPLLKE